MECFHLIMLPEPESLKQHKAKLQPSGGMLGELLVPLPLPWLQQEFLQREVVTRLPMHLSTADLKLPFRRLEKYDDGKTN